MRGRVIKGSLSLLFVLCIFFCAFACFKKPIKKVEASNIFEIYTVADFFNIQNNKHGTYILKNNIDFSGIGANFEPFDFYGVLEGNGYTICNLNIVCENSNLGLFSSLNNAIIKNLKIVNFQVYGNKNAGVLAGNIFNSFVSCVDVILNNNYIFGQNAGLLAGFIENSEVKNLYVSGGLINGFESITIASIINKSVINVREKQNFNEIDNGLDNIIPDIDIDKPLPPPSETKPSKPSDENENNSSDNTLNKPNNNEDNSINNDNQNVDSSINFDKNPSESVNDILNDFENTINEKETTNNFFIKIIITLTCLSLVFGNFIFVFFKAKKLKNKK